MARRFIILIFLALFLAILIPYLKNLHDDLNEVEDRKAAAWADRKGWGERLRLEDLPSKKKLVSAPSRPETLQDKDVIICGLARNIESALERNLPKLHRLSQEFRSAYFLFFENDSTDRTPEMLKEFVARPDVQGEAQCLKLNWVEIGKGLGVTSGEIRYEKMAYARNELSKMIRGTDERYKYVMMFDLDFRGGYSLEGIQDTFARDDWDQVFGFAAKMETLYHANRLRYYDRLAHRSETGQRASFVDLPGFKYFDKKIDMKTLNNLVYREDWLKVSSGFNVLSIFKRDLFDTCEYIGTENDCEHLSFNDAMIAQGRDRIYYNPRMMILS